MNVRQEPLAAGLYLVATPIGNARDITLRALDVLASAEVLAAEDTRTARKLMELHGLDLRGRRLISYHDHSSAGDRARIVEAVKAGQSVAYLSEAGTPLVADPGFHLVQDLRAEGCHVTAVPGASSTLAALCLSGQPSDRFLFLGFLPAAAGARRALLSDVARLDASLIILESPKRLDARLGDLAEVLGADRPASLCRELTKKFEEVRSGTLETLRQGLAEAPVKGEVVLVLGRPGEEQVDASDLDEALTRALAAMPVKEAAATVAGAFGLPRREVYQRALDLKSSD